MQQKISLVYDHIQRGETDCALKLIENINKKDSKKSKLSEEGVNLLSLLKCICLIRNNEFGEALNIFKNFIQDNNVHFK